MAINTSTLYHEIYESHPDREWIVLVHGAGGSVKTFKYQIETFKRHFNLLLLDLRDHGNSQHLPAPTDGKYSFKLMAQDILDLMKVKGISQAHFLGVSMGSIVTRWIEYLRPGQVLSMIYAGGVFKLKFWIRYGLKLGVNIAKLIPFRVLSRALSFLIMPKRNHQAARRLFLREADRIDPKAFHKWLNMTKKLGKELDVFFKLPVSAPTLSVMGDQDHAFLPAARAFTQANEKASLEIIPKCGHVCNIEGARHFNRRVLAWLKNLDRPQKTQEERHLVPV